MKTGLITYTMQSKRSTSLNSLQDFFFSVKYTYSENINKLFCSSVQFVFLLWVHL